MRPEGWAPATAGGPLPVIPAAAIREKATGNLHHPRFSTGEVARALGGPVWHLGSGTFGDTWRHGDSAVKILCGQPVEDARLQREVAGLSRVSSPYVVHLDSTGIVELGGREYHALVFEYI
jgi:hypothetical protein